MGKTFDCIMHRKFYKIWQCLNSKVWCLMLKSADILLKQNLEYDDKKPNITRLAIN
jgi:hypothetical protein